MRGIALCALVLIALPARAEWIALSARQAEGMQVERIRFSYSGEKLILNRMLRAAMRTKEEGTFGRRVFNEDLVSITNLYRSRGYREARIARKRIETDGRTERVRLLIEIDNGPLWTVRAVHLRGAADFPRCHGRRTGRNRRGGGRDGSRQRPRKGGAPRGHGRRAGCSGRR